MADTTSGAVPDPRDEDLEETTRNARVFVYDRRKAALPELKVDIGGLLDFAAFENKLRSILRITSNEEYVIVTTDRNLIHDDESYCKYIDDEVTLYILEDINQPLLAPTRERVDYLPHYDTLVKSGMYEYYASEGKNPLPFAFAELIDNALTATNENAGPRNIEVRMYFSDVPEKCMVSVIDNGRGMTSIELNNWAIYRLSKFSQKRRQDTENAELIRSEKRQSDTYPRFLNSDISYFGVGGKAAIFFIGQSARMISKSSSSGDVHELSISKEEFERREREKEEIYKGYIHNRQPGDVSHLTSGDETMTQILQEELGKESFTHVVITGMKPEHIKYLSEDFNRICTQLVHIYHYYIYGPSGNNPHSTPDRASSPFRHININISHFNKGKLVQRRNLRDVDDDMQSKFILSSAASFEFQAKVEGDAVVQGVLRYHPFLYNRETYPLDNTQWLSTPGDGSDDGGDFIPKDRPARGNRPIFECFWNGRLIPYTTVDEFDWCGVPKRSSNIPVECYNRLSGVLWTNDKFQVSTNKLTFLDLGIRLREKTTFFERVTSGQAHRNIQRKFTDWLKECHEKHDKQVIFQGHKGCITRDDIPNKKHQYPWSVYQTIIWEGKRFTTGQLVRTSRTNPIIYGTIKNFLLFGFYEGDVFATGGDFVVEQEPKMLYNNVKVFPLSRLDRSVNERSLTKGMEEEEGKLPDSLVVNWPTGNQIKQGDKVPAGSVIGDVQVKLVNKRGEELTKLPSANAPAKRFLIEQKLIKHSSSGDSQIVYHISQHNKQWSHWFNKMDVMREMGNFSLVLQAVLGESDATTFGGKTLPSVKIKFQVIEGAPAKFNIGLMEGPCRVGVPFSIPLQLRDKFNHLSKPDTELVPHVKANGLELKWEKVEAKNGLLYIKNVTAKGKVLTTQDFNLKVTIPSLQDSSQNLKVRMLPGAIRSIKVAEFEKDKISLYNGEALSLEVELLDEAGNITMERGAKLLCKFLGRPKLPVYKATCSNSGVTMLTGKPIDIKMTTTAPVKLTASVELEGISAKVPPAEKTVEVLPGTLPHFINVKYKDQSGKDIKLVDGEVVECAVGEAISNIEFAIWDEGRRQIQLSPSLVSKITVNWQSKPDKDILRSGRLPDVKAPTKIDESKYCKIDIAEGKGLSFSFSIKPLVGPPHHLRCDCKGSTTLRLNEFLESTIEVHVTDSYGNQIKRLPQRSLSKLKVSAVGLDEKALEIRNLPNIGFGLDKIRFVESKLGPKDILVEYENFRDTFRVTLESGIPTQLQFLNYAPNDVVHIHKNDFLPKSLTLQLCDINGNPCKEASAVATATVPKDLQLKAFSTTMKPQKNGRFEFGRPQLDGEWKRYEIAFSAVLGKKKLTGVKLFVLIEPDQNRPSKLEVQYERSWTCTAGENLPDFTVWVTSEAGTTLKGLPTQSVLMRQWKPINSQHSKPPASAFSWVVDTRKIGDQSDHFYFRKRKAPDSAGFHHIIFEGNFKGVKLQSNLIVINVKPGPAAILASDDTPPSTMSVSNTPHPPSRCLISSLKLYLKDQYGNRTGQTVHGRLKVTLYGKDSTEVPKLNQNKSSALFPLQNGAALLTDLYLQQGTPGKDGCEYVLKVEVDSITSKDPPVNVKPYLQPFMFYNDVKKQERMLALTRERDECRLLISKYDQMFADSKEVHDTLKSEVKQIEQKEGVMKNNLKKLGIPHTAMLSLDAVEDTLKLCQGSKTSIEKTPRRRCMLPKFQSSDPDVLGKVAHLAEVEDNTIAWVLSWHLMSEMDCVITKTTAKAKEVHAATGGSQQVLPIDSIFTKNLPNWVSPLPHEKVQSLRLRLQPTGNPIHARHLLKFTKEEEDCQLLFRMILGDTIIFDTLEDATEYRKQVVQFTSCPTLLTREGNRMRSSGKFGGFQNRAPPVEKLRGNIFGAPIPAKYEQILKQIELLGQLKEIIKEKESAVVELQDHLNQVNSAKTQTQKRDYEETKERLEQVEAKLRSVSKDHLAPIPMETLEESRSTSSRKSPRGQARDPRLQRTTTRRSAGSPVSKSPEAKRRR